MTHRADAAEAITNSLVGLPISWAATFWILPLFGLYPSAGQSLGVTGLFVFLSFSRAFVLRVIFRRLWARKSDA